MANLEEQSKIIQTALATGCLGSEKNSSEKPKKRKVQKTAAPGAATPGTLDPGNDVTPPSGTWAGIGGCEK